MTRISSYQLASPTDKPHGTSVRRDKDRLSGKIIHVVVPARITSCQYQADVAREEWAGVQKLGAPFHRPKSSRKKRTKASIYNLSEDRRDVPLKGRRAARLCEFVRSVRGRQSARRPPPALSAGGLADNNVDRA
ncbi:hypothetical protein EVAR_78371_1 [Eumeta japonica]|uniref:Uncharacterized protein n=1 Tax=Eumeta variegata TaxID=151549 RepID=A0A4C1T4C0_EUMVA|nr:hypothetical protein EVAR_78371_1 [Eumeta japonica]